MSKAMVPLADVAEIVVASFGDNKNLFVRVCDPVRVTKEE